MTTPTTLTTTQLQWLCAMYERECPGPIDPITSIFINYRVLVGGGVECDVCRAKSTVAPYFYNLKHVRVPLLEGVRTPCLAGPDCEGTKRNNHRGCTVCHGLGWTPTEDAWKWLATAKHFTQDFDPQGTKYPGLSLPEKVKAEFFTKAEAALQSLAINAAEAQEWVKEKP